MEREFQRRAMAMKAFDGCSLVMEVPADDLPDIGDPLSWWRIDSKEALESEGSNMRHCLASYHKKIAAGLARAYSLRNSAGKPLATVEVSSEPNQPNQLVQIKGFANEASNLAFAPAVIALIGKLRTMNPDLKVDKCPDLNRAGIYSSRQGSLQASNREYLWFAVDDGKRRDPSVAKKMEEEFERHLAGLTKDKAIDKGHSPEFHNALSMSCKLGLEQARVRSSTLWGESLDGSSLEEFQHALLLDSNPMIFPLTHPFPPDLGDLPAHEPSWDAKMGKRACEHIHKAWGLTENPDEAETIRMFKCAMAVMRAKSHETLQALTMTRAWRQAVENAPPALLASFRLMAEKNGFLISSGPFFDNARLWKASEADSDDFLSMARALGPEAFSGGKAEDFLNVLSTASSLEYISAFKAILQLVPAELNGAEGGEPDKLKAFAMIKKFMSQRGFVFPSESLGGGMLRSGDGDDDDKLKGFLLSRLTQTAGDPSNPSPPGDKELLAALKFALDNRFQKSVNLIASTHRFKSMLDGHFRANDDGSQLNKTCLDAALSSDFPHIPVKALWFDGQPVNQEMDSVISKAVRANPAVFKNTLQGDVVKIVSKLSDLGCVESSYETVRAVLKTINAGSYAGSDAKTLDFLLAKSNVGLAVSYASAKDLYCVWSAKGNGSFDCATNLAISTDMSNPRSIRGSAALFSRLGFDGQLKTLLGRCEDETAKRHVISASCLLAGEQTLDSLLKDCSCADLKWARRFSSWALKPEAFERIVLETGRRGVDEASSAFVERSVSLVAKAKIAAKSITRYASNRAYPVVTDTYYQ